MAVLVQLNDLQARAKLCKAHDDQKHALIDGLFAYIEDISGKLSEAEAELHDKKDVIKLNRTRIEEATRQIQELQIEKNRHAFASVIVDGDCMPFKDDLIKLGLEGGKKAAQLLKQAVEQLLKSSDSSAAPTHHLQVIIRVYANLKGLSGTYNDMEVLSEHTFSEFVSGFNMGDVLCDYVDAGSGKECSDEKVKAIFRFHLDDVHCQQILFGGSADNGYARLLGPYVEHDALRARVVLIEGPPFAQELAAIKDKFRTVSLESVFRNQKLVNAKRKVSFGVTPPATPANATAYALVAAQAHFINTSLPAATTAQKSPAPSAKAVQSTPPVYRNKQNERVDAPLRYSQEEFMNLKGRKLCNNYHLLGKCGAFDSFRECHHEHGKPLSESQKAALRALARQAPCQAGLDCDDPRCIWGHRCLRMNCIREICWFSPEMHNVDTKVVT